MTGLERVPGESEEWQVLSECGPRKPVTRVLACVVLAAVSSCARKPNEVVHPTSGNVPPPGSAVVRSEGPPLGLDAVALDSWSSVRDGLLSQWEVVAALGSAGDVGADTPDVFGIELDLVVEGDDIVVLDRRNYSIKVFNLDGVHVESFGRAGSGPGEFRDPTAIERLADGSLAVLDRGREIKLYSHSDSRYVYTGNRRLDLVPEYMCAVEDRVFVSGWRMEDNTMIHEVPLAPIGRMQHFGRGYLSDEVLVQDQMSDGPIACVEDPLRVVLAFERLPVVRGYAVEGGALLWTSRNEDYLQPPIVERRDGAGRLGISFSNRGARDMVASLTAVSNTHVLLQNVRFEPKRDPADVQLAVRSYLMDAATGQGAFISESLPLVAGVEAEYYVALWVLPFPRIEVRRFDLATRP